MDEELTKSELGTKIYWDEVYGKELENFSDYGDTGEIWFGQDSVDRMVNWLEKCNLMKKTSSVLDLGCGNGIFLVELAKLGYTNLTGVDYSEKAVNLAVAIAEKEQVNIIYKTCDIVSDMQRAGDSGLCGVYDVCVDKGTYDAISLRPESAKEHRNRYIENVCGSLCSNGLFVITSCNWTEEELKHQFTGKDLIFLEKIKTPTFQFGGKLGNRETSLVFQKT